MKKIKFFFFKRNFSSIKFKIKPVDSNKFIEMNDKKKSKFFDKQFLTYAMTYNVIYFCAKYWELSNTAKIIRPLLISLKYKGTRILYKTNNSYFGKFFFLSWINKKLFFNKFSKIITTFFNFKINTILKLKNVFKDKIHIFNTTKLNKKIKLENKNKENKNKENKIKQIVNAFILIWSTRNNFFVTVLDNNGHTLVTRSGGMSEWTASRQRASVFSADSAVYEACFLAKKRGVECLSIHVRSTFWLPQIRNSFDGLEASGLEINELLYRPKMAFGGCRKKKPRRV